MIRDPDGMTPEEGRQMQLEVAARIADARVRWGRPAEHDRAYRELKRLHPLQDEIGRFEIE